MVCVGSCMLLCLFTFLYLHVMTCTCCHPHEHTYVPSTTHTATSPCCQCGQQWEECRRSRWCAPRSGAPPPLRKSRCTVPHTSVSEPWTCTHIRTVRYTTSIALSHRAAKDCTFPATWSAYVASTHSTWLTYIHTYIDIHGMDTHS
jgi:hypothetical protein